MRASILLAALAALASSLDASAAGALENPPDGPASGISVISGWHCSATRIEIEFDGGIRLLAGTHTDRLDTQSVCGKRDNGFGRLFAWNARTPGIHTIRAFADGVEFGARTINVVSLGADFLTGK